MSGACDRATLEAVCQQTSCCHTPRQVYMHHEKAVELLERRGDVLMVHGLLDRRHFQVHACQHGRDSAALAGVKALFMLDTQSTPHCIQCP